MQHNFTIVIMLATVAASIAATQTLAAGGTYDESDGVIQISQVKANVGDYLPGDSPGFPVTISQPGSYRLQGNLSVTDPTKNAIEITASDVTLDLAGFRISGPVVCGGLSAATIACSTATTSAGVYAANRQSVVVRNGTIRGFGYGVRLGNYSRAEALQIAHSANTGISGGRASQILQNTVVLSAYAGISADGAVRDNAVHMIRFHGILASNGSLVAGNRVSETGGDGIASAATGKASLVGNSVWGSAMRSIYGVTQIGGNACNGDACP